ncbi:MAG: phosphoribosyltransferase [Aquificae bacterium]|nr:phosphoribosyltransferase [Aquificota bacterium]
MFKDREEAGKLLAQALAPVIDYSARPIVLAIPRGGIPVAYQIAKTLKIPMSIVVVRKLGLPWNEEAGFGAVDPTGTAYYEESVLRFLSPEDVKKVLEKELKELKERERKFLPEGYPDLRGRQVIIVDDGVATGYTAIAAAQFAKKMGAKEVIVAVPVCPVDAKARIAPYVDKFICYYPVSSPHFAVGMFYQDFHQLTDEEALSYIRKAKEEGLFEPTSEAGTP